MDWINEKAKTLRQGAIRAMFDKASTMDNVISMGIGEPDMATPELVCRAGNEALEKGITHYTPNAGTPALRRAIAEKSNLKGVGYDPTTEIIITNGGMGALSLLFLVLLNPGDEVLIQDPQWLNYVAQVRYCGGEAVRVPTDLEHNFTMQPEAIEQRITPRTKALMINSPNNPTGSVMSRADMEQIAAIAKKHDLLIIADEVYNTLLYGTEPYLSIAELPGMKDRCVVINSFSKSYAMTGWRIGYSLGPEHITKVMSNYVSHSTAAPSTLSQWAAVEALNGPQDTVETMRQAFEQRRNYMVERVNSMELVSCLKPEGAFYIMMNIRKVLGKKIGGVVIDNCDTFASQLLEKGLVAVVPGSGFEAPDFVRWSYATSMENIKEGMDRLEKFLGALED